MACGGDDDYLNGFAQLSIKSNKKLVEIAQGKRGKNLALNEELCNKLYDYQKDGVRWLFGLYERGKGGILGDDMGLGKTIQVIAFLSGMMDCKFIRCALIIAPMSVINVWSTSFKEFSPRTTFATFHGDKRGREKALERIQDRGGILVTTYDLVGRDGDRLGRDGYGDHFEWDYVIADEGHQLKNKSIKRSQGAHSVPTKYRVILTGTPLQNRLPELWALFDFTHFGQLLGTMRTFNQNYGTAIEEGRKKCASAHARRLGNEFAESLRKIIEPYLLRRTKDEVGLNNNRPISSASQKRSGSSASDGSASPSASGSNHQMPSLPRKNDLVVWLTLSKEQEDIYRRFLTTPEVKMLLDPSVKTSPLTQLIVLKKLCDHPRLLSENACRTLGITFDPNVGEQQNEQTAAGGAATNAPAIAVGDEEIDDLAVCIAQSIKTAFLTEMLPQLVNEGHKVLVFSMSLRMLNVVAQILKNRLGIKFLRLDGRVTKLEERRKILDKYQTSDRYKVLLLTTQVGGVGLTITAADRVIIVDPAWNPAVDSQAVDRVYRVGQKRNVVIYRLITAGTVEEKIYRRQVFKVSIFKQIAHSSNAAVSSNNAADDPMRYFTQQDLKELFKLSDTKSSDTQRQLMTMHAHQRNSDAELDGHINFVTGLRGVAGLSDHDLLFTKPDDTNELENGDEELRAREMVQRAKALIERENLNPGAGDVNPGRQRNPLAEKQPEEGGGGMYPRGFGANNRPMASQSNPQFAKPKFEEPLMQLPTEMPLYLQRKGKTIFSPPKVIGRGQKEKSFTLHRSYSDAEINAVGAKNDDLIVLDEDGDKGNDSADETLSLDESRIQQNNRRRTNRVNDDSESTVDLEPDELEPKKGQSGDDTEETIDLESQDLEPETRKSQESRSSSGGPIVPQNRPRKVNRIEDDSMEVDQEAKNEVVISDSDDEDVQIVEPPLPNRQSIPSSSINRQSVASEMYHSVVEPPSSRQSVPHSEKNANDSVIKSGWKGRNRKVIDDDDEEETKEKFSTSAGTASPPSQHPSVVVIDENGNKDPPIGAPRFPRLSTNASGDGTPAFGPMPINSSTPFNPGPAALLKPHNQQPRLQKFPSAISPLVGKTPRFVNSNEKPLELANNQPNSSHGTKRASHNRSLEIAPDSDASKNQSTNVVPNSVVISDEEEDDERTGSTDSNENEEVVEETTDQMDVEDEQITEEELTEEEITDEEETNESESHISLPEGGNGDASFAF